MKVIITGGRDYEYKDMVYKVLDFFAPDMIIVGDCPTGADALAYEWATQTNNWTDVKIYKADWKKHGKSAGPKRNKQMIEQNIHADVVIAFKGGKGTANTISLARKAGLLVFEVNA